MAENDAHPAVGGANDTAYVYILIAVVGKVADFSAVRRQAEDSEAALGIGEIGRAGVEKAGTVGEFDDVKDVGADANVFVGLLGGIGR